MSRTVSLLLFLIVAAGAASASAQEPKDQAPRTEDGQPDPRELLKLPPGAGPPAQLSNVNSPDGQRFTVYRDCATRSRSNTVTR